MLPSGCVCCTLRSDLQQTLNGLLIRRDRGEVPPFSRILVETTGLADPAPIVQLLLNNPLVSHFVRLDTVVTTVDAVNGLRQIDEHAEAVKQAALADRLLLTKVDLAAATRSSSCDGGLWRLIPERRGDLVITWRNRAGRAVRRSVVRSGAQDVDVQRWINEAAYGAGP